MAVAKRFYGGLYLTAIAEHDSWKGTELENKEKLVDTSGYVPLDIRMKKIDIATAQRKLELASYDYHDTEELYNDDVIFSKYDSLEELQAKIDSYNEKKKKLLASKFAEYRAKREATRTQEPKPNPQQPVNTQQTTQPDNNNNNV